MSKPPPPAPTASAVGPCPTIIRIVGSRSVLLLKCFHEILYKSDDKQRKITIPLLSILTEWCPFVLQILFWFSVVVRITYCLVCCNTNSKSVDRHWFNVVSTSWSWVNVDWILVWYCMLRGYCLCKKMIIYVKKNDKALLVSLLWVNRFSVLLCKMDTLILFLGEMNLLPSPYIPVLS